MVEIEYFVQSYRFAFLDFVFAFSSPVAKMSQTSSGDDTMVGKTVPSTTVDSSKGTGTTRPVSSSNASDAGNTGGGTVIIKPPPKFGARKLALTRAST